MELRKNYFLAYLDILGFSNIVQSKTKGQVEKVLTAINDAISGVESYKSFEHIIFSDTILIYIKKPSSHDGWRSFKTFREVCFIVQSIQRNCAINNVWLRGAISYGEMLEVNVGEFKNIYGKALIDAYKTEQIARFPRVVISNQVFKIIPSHNISNFIDSTNNHSQNPHNNHLLFDWGNHNVLDGISADCITFVDYFSKLDPSEANTVLNIIKSNLKESDLKTFEKYYWLKKYLLSVVETVDFENNSLKQAYIDDLYRL